MEKLRKSFTIEADDLRTFPNEENANKKCELDDLLYEFPAKTRLTIDRRLDILRLPRPGLEPGSPRSCDFVARRESDAFWRIF